MCIYPHTHIHKHIYMADVCDESVSCTVLTRIWSIIRL